YNLVKAGSGAEALRLMLKEEFALVLLDVVMPIMDGFETAELMRQRPQTAQLPIVFITAGSTNEDNITRGHSLGAVAYVNKPINPEILKGKIQVFIELFRKTRSLEASEAALRRELVERTKAEEALREERERYKGLFARASDAIIVFDSDDRVLD